MCTDALGNLKNKQSKSITKLYQEKRCGFIATNCVWLNYSVYIVGTERELSQILSF